jgi:hypothetical protein
MPTIVMVLYRSTGILGAPTRLLAKSKKAKYKRNMPN